MMHECEYMNAAKTGLEKTTFHGIPWVLEDVHWISKVYKQKFLCFIGSPRLISDTYYHLLHN